MHVRLIFCNFLFLSFLSSANTYYIFTIYSLSKWFLTSILYILMFAVLIIHLGNVFCSIHILNSVHKVKSKITFSYFFHWSLVLYKTLHYVQSFHNLHNKFSFENIFRLDFVKRLIPEEKTLNHRDELYQLDNLVGNVRTNHIDDKPFIVSEFVCLWVCVLLCVFVFMCFNHLFTECLERLLLGFGHWALLWPALKQLKHISAGHSFLLCPLFPHKKQKVVSSKYLIWF